MSSNYALELVRINGASIYTGGLDIAKKLLHPDMFNVGSPEENDVVMSEFVFTVGSAMTRDELCKLTSNLIDLTADEFGKNDKTKSNNLAELFLAYAKSTAPLESKYFDTIHMLSRFSPQAVDSMLNQRYFALMNRYSSVQSDSRNIEISTFIRLTEQQANDKVKERCRDLIDFVLDSIRNETIEEDHLIKSLELTKQLLTGQVTLNSYHDAAMKEKGKPEETNKLLGGLMVAIGIAVAAVGALIAFSGIGAIPGGVFMMGGTAISLLGYGIFSQGKATGLSKAMLDVEEQVSSTPKP